jgi:hypothetical protein
MTTEYRFKTGPIPDEAFENDTGAPNPERYDRMMSKEFRQEMDAHIAETLASIKKMREGK